MHIPISHPELDVSRSIETPENVLTQSAWSSVIAAASLKPEIETVERYFGGSSYSADNRTREGIRDAIDHACGIVSAQVAFVIKPILSLDSDGTITLPDGKTVPLPTLDCNGTASFLSAAIGTLGKELEMECRLLAAQHHMYQSTLLDAVGTAMLDCLDTRIRCMIDAECRPRGFFSVARFAPGLNGYPMTYQQSIFELADGISMNIRINDAFMMEPVKTISFFSLLGSQETTIRNPDKCNECRMWDCHFRKKPDPGSLAGMTRRDSN
jgi:hypothetical protein